MIKNERLQAIPTASALGVQQVIGLGIVLKASLLTPLIEAATANIRAMLASAPKEPTLPAEEGSKPIVPANEPLPNS